ncbi:hypothetical protein OG729_03000 [Streptomyces sp. NBC_00210]
MKKTVNHTAGTATAVAASAVTATALAVFVRQFLPDIMRYLRIRRM